jgi:hypothetical protein
MRGLKIIGFSVALLALFAVSIAIAGPWRGWKGSGGWGMGTQYQRTYNPATVETISGTVESVDQVRPMKGMNYGIHIMIKSEKDVLTVHLGPGWYVERLDTKIEKGDKVQVKGSKVTIAGKQVMIAAEVRKGDSTLLLRDSAGIPAWAGWKR